MGKPHPKAAIVGHSNVLVSEVREFAQGVNVGEVEDDFAFRCMTVQFWENFIGSRNVHVERAAEVFLFR